MKLRGYLKELPDGKFVVRHADLNKVKPIFIDVPLHPSMVNNTDLEHGKEIEFIVKQIAIGEDEFSVVDCDVALLVYDEIPQDTSILDQIVENYPDDEILKADGLDGGRMYRQACKKSKQLDDIIHVRTAVATVA